MNKQVWKLLKVSLVIAGLLGGQVAAQTSSSTNYQTNEYMFGSGGELDSTSASYRAHSNVGALGVGRSASESYDAEAGFITPSEPFLEMVVTEQTVNLGDLSDTAYSSGAAQGGGCSCSFNIRTYLSQEYVVLTVSQPPISENNDILDAKTTLGAPSSDPTVEEFGINLVDNSNPDIGANSVNVPDNSFADGTVETGYNTVNQFKYGVGDIVAKSPATAGNQAVGQTDFTISYIAKRRTFSDAGVYTMNHVLVVVATY